MTASRSFVSLTSRSATVAALVLAIAAPLSAQRQGQVAKAAAAPTAAPRAAAATPAPATPTVDVTPKVDTLHAFSDNSLHIGPRIWAGVYGTMAYGIAVEKAYGSARKELGNGRIGIGASVDMYSYGQSYVGYSWSYRVIPIAGFVNYHIDLKNPKLDPYAGIGLGYNVISASVNGPTGSFSAARGSNMFLGLQLGARYFVKPNLAVQAQTGLGVGNLALGVSWKR
jgi:outer membrane protein W